MRTRSTQLRNASSLSRRSSRGAVMVEYAILLVVVAIPTTAGIVAGGIAMLNNFEKTRTAIINNSP